MSESSLHNSVLPRLDELSPALRQAADYVLSNPQEIAMRSLRQISESSDIKAPTYSRLARALGFERYEDLRELCRSEIHNRSTTFADKAAALQKRKSNVAGAFFLSHAAANVANIEKLATSLDLSSLAAVADRLASARQVILIGVMSAGGLVDYLGYLANMALGNWRVAARNHEPISVHLLDLEPKDAVLVVTQHPYARTTVEAAARAATVGATVIAITDSYTSPVCEHADHIFITPTESPHFFPSEVATVLLFEALLGMVVRRSGPKARRRIAAVENGSHQSGEYWQEQ